MLKCTGQYVCSLLYLLGCRWGHGDALSTLGEKKNSPDTAAGTAAELTSFYL